MKKLPPEIISIIVRKLDLKTILRNPNFVLYTESHVKKEIGRLLLNYTYKYGCWQKIHIMTANKKYVMRLSYDGHKKFLENIVIFGKKITKVELYVEGTQQTHPMPEESLKSSDIGIDKCENKSIYQIFLDGRHGPSPSYIRIDVRYYLKNNMVNFKPLGNRLCFYDISLTSVVVIVHAQSLKNVYSNLSFDYLYLEPSCFRRDTISGGKYFQFISFNGDARLHNDTLTLMRPVALTFGRGVPGWYF